MGLLRRGITKAALGIAALIGAGVAIGSAAKKKYKESKTATAKNYNNGNANYNSGNVNYNSGNANYTAGSSDNGFKRAQHVYPKTYYKKVQPHEYPRDYYPKDASAPNTTASETINESPKVSATPVNETKSSYNNTAYETKQNINKDKKSKTEKYTDKKIQEKINSISDVNFDKYKGGMFALFFWMVLVVGFVFALMNILDFITVGQTIALSIFSLLFIIFVLIFIKALRYKKSLKCVEQVIGNVKYRLDNYKRESVNNPNSTLENDIIIYQSAYDNLCEAYNNYVSASSNALYRSMFSTTLIDRDEIEEKVELKRVS